MSRQYGRLLLTEVDCALEDGGGWILAIDGPSWSGSGRGAFTVIGSGETTSMPLHISERPHV